MTTCPLCGGAKTIIGMFPVYADSVPQEDRKPFVEMTCFTCKGAGEISPEHVERIEAGKRLRAKRRTTELGIRECAVAMGMKDICDLPRAEQGDVSLEQIAHVDRWLDRFIAERQKGGESCQEILISTDANAHR